MIKLLTWLGVTAAILLVLLSMRQRARFGYLQGKRDGADREDKEGSPAFVQKKKYLLWCAAIVLLGGAIRLWKLAQYPAGINCDEIGMAYDAFCLSHFGTDRFLNPFPMYLINYGGGQSAVYAYFCALLFRVFGVSLAAARVPAAVSGIATIMLSGAIAKELYGRRTSVITMLLVAVCPFFITSSRFGLDCNLFLGFSLFSFYMLLLAVKRQTGRSFLAAGVCYGVTLYTYSLSWIVLPVFLILAAVYLLYVKQITWKLLLAWAVPVVVLAVPLLLFLVINTFELGSLITPFFSIPQLPQFRAGEFSLPNLERSWNAVKYILTTDSSQFFAYDDYATLYKMSIPFILLGIGIMGKHCVQALYHKRMYPQALLFFYFAAALGNAVCLETPNIYRNNSIYFPLVIAAALGIHYVCKALGNRRWVTVLLIGLYGLHFMSFCSFYYSGRVKERYPIVWFSYDYIDDLFTYIKENEMQQDIYIDDMNMTTYCYAMLINEVSPYEFAAEGNDAATNDNNFRNLHFYLPDNPESLTKGKIYIVMDYNVYNENFIGRGFEKQTYGYYNIYY